MKHSGRAIASFGLMIGCAIMAAITKDGCVSAACIIIGTFFIWMDAD